MPEMIAPLNDNIAKNSNTDILPLIRNSSPTVVTAVQNPPPMQMMSPINGFFPTQKNEQLL